jgi:pimeloyl-ACP methyl ester carboxylesterase
VVYEAPASWEPWWNGREAGSGWERRDPADLAEGFMRQVIGDSIWDRLPDSTRLQRRSEGTTMMAEIAALGARRPFDPEAITVPVIVARGEPADPRHVRSSDTLATAIPGAELVLVEGADHGAHLSHPAEMAELMRRCLARAQPR